MTQKGNINTVKPGDKNDNEEKDMIKITWKDVEVGNILKLERDDIVPADMIILDSNEIRDREAICLIDSYAVDGKVDYVKKKASNLTKIPNRLNPQKNKFSQYKNKFTGKIEYEPPTPDLSSFIGSFRLSKDP